MKSADMFATLKDYNKYLEELESIIYNIIYDVDTEETKGLYGSLKRKNAMRLDVSNEEMAKRRETYLFGVIQKAGRTQRQSMLEDRAFGRVSGEAFLQTAHTLFKTEEPSVVASEVSSSSTTTPAPGTMPPPAAGYTYRPQVQPSGLPRPVATPVGGRVLPGSVQKPDPRQGQTGGGTIARDVVPTYLTPDQEVRSAAGGYKFEIVKKRALEEALGGLFLEV